MKKALFRLSLGIALGTGSYAFAKILPEWGWHAGWVASALYFWMLEATQ